MVSVKRLACCRMALALLCGTGGLKAQVSAPGTASPVRSMVSRYVTALQRRDYRTIVELNDGLRLNESVIQSDNPKVLWPKLIAGYRDRMVRVLKGEDVKPLDIADELELRQVRKEISEQLSLVPPECKWAVGEVRPGRDLVGHRFTDIFVTVTYLVRETSPKNTEGQPLQRAILRFFVKAPDNSTVEYFERVLAGEIAWKTLPE